MESAPTSPSAEDIAQLVVERLVQGGAMSDLAGATHFSHYTRITDLMHALSYVYAAAVASCGRLEDSWSLYLVWLQWIWRGEVTKVIDELQQIASDQEEVPERSVVQSPI